MDNTHWIIRVSDGINFKKSKYPFWGVKRKGGIKCLVEQMKKGDILWFLTNKTYGGIFIGMAEFVCFYDRKDEPLIQINTYSNEEQGWLGNEDWDIQIHYTNYYNTERQNITAIIPCSAVIMNYNNNVFVFNRIQDNLFEHYKNFVYYAEPKETFKTDN
jgi:hypothetical protein